MIRLIVVEDDHLQAESLSEHLRRAFGDVHIQILRTESEFRDAMPALRAKVPDVVVMDVMLRWTNPRPDQPAMPADVVAGGYYRAGLRCAQLLFKDSQLRDVRIILYTILELSDLTRNDRSLPGNCTYLGKNSEPDALVRHIRARLRSPVRAQR